MKIIVKDQETKDLIEKNINSVTSSQCAIIMSNNSTVVGGKSIIAGLNTLTNDKLKTEVTMNKDFTLYPEASELKQLGFDEPCFKYIYTGDTGNNVNIPCEVLPSKAKNYNEDDLCVSTPTYSQAFRWFREKHGLYGNLSSWTHEEKIGIYYEFEIYGSPHSSQVTSVSDTFKTYEEAEIECVRRLIGILKNK